MASSTTKQYATSRLLAVVYQLPPTKLTQLILHVGFTATIQLSLSCRTLKEKIQGDVILWQCLYQDRFLNGLRRVKEWDFVYWCARDQFLADNMPIESTALLEKLDWYDVYRRRITTEQNWRSGHSKRIVFSYPCGWKYKRISLKQLSANAVLLSNLYKGNDDESGHNSIVENNDDLSNNAMPKKVKSRFQVNILGTTPIPLVINQNDIKDTAESEMIPTIKSIDFYDKLRDGSYGLTDRFAIVISTELDAKLMRVYTRNDFKLRYTSELPSDFVLEAVNGQWAVFSRKDWVKRKTLQVIAYDLEKNKQYVNEFKKTMSAICIYEATRSYVTIYAMFNDDYNCKLQWSLHRVSQDGLMQKLQQGEYEIGYRSNRVFTTTSEFSHIKVSTNPQGYDIFPHLHTLSLTKKDEIELDEMHGIPLSVEEKEMRGVIYSELLKKKDSDHEVLVFNNGFDWSSVVKYQHIIGNLFFVFQKNNENLDQLLVDMSCGKVIRKIDAVNIKHIFYILMTGIIIIDENSLTIETVNYGAI
ncbi:hypothetical protein BDF19DRAFT_437291 [Syncephalis fuscata]|nr:hypothetical protein BDF19DRAFT_437291 [Syncephalis fuscata]